MIFGDKQTFAVELELDENPGGAWLFGHFCYWIGGVRVGDYEVSTSLRDVLAGMKWVVHDCGNRDGGALCGSKPQTIFSRLDASLYGSDECDGDDSFRLPDTPARFEITLAVEVFNEWKAFLVECGDEARLLYRKVDGADATAVTIPTGLFDKATRAAYDYLDQMHEGEVA